MSLLEKQFAPLSSNLIYPTHPDRITIDLDHPANARDHFRDYLRYQHSQLYVPHAEAIATRVDPYLIPEASPDLFLGHTTAEILANFRRIDPFTHGHSASVAEMGLELQKILPDELGLRDIPRHELFLALILHDIKKLEQNNLLNYPDLHSMMDRGTFVTSLEAPQISWFPNEGEYFAMLDPDSAVFGPDEKAVIHQHPLEGALHLLRLNMPPVVIAGALMHHSRFVYPLEDAGYPHLDEIAQYPELLRVLDEVPPAFFDLANVCDHAATAEACRPYKPILPPEVVEQRLQAMGSERRIHPSFAKAYRHLIQKQGATWMRHTIHVPCVRDNGAIRVPTPSGAQSIRRMAA